VLPSSVAEVGAHYGALIEDLKVQALAELAPALRRGRRSPEAWRNAVQALGNRLLVLQVTAAMYADAYLNDVLDTQDVNPTAEGRVNPGAWSDLADGGGSWLQTLVFAPNSVRAMPGLPGVEWWTRFQFVANTIVATGVRDAARGSVQAGMQARPAVTGYVRMLKGKSCARCAILAGRHYRSAIPFRRHKRCDCIHVPAAEDADDWTTDPKVYFNSLTRAEQDRLFTKASAEAIRLGANMNQVVNARSGIQTVTAYGKQVKATTTGTTTRALFGGYEILPDGTLRRRTDSELQRRRGSRGTRNFRYAKAPRLLPDEIFQLAEEFSWDRAEVLRQLRRFAYVL
jgi:hypothetical protein